MDPFKNHLQAMNAYIPGEQPAPGEKVIKLNTNENPYPPSPKVREALQTFDLAGLRRYGDPMAGALRQALHESLGLQPDWILPGNGSDDVIVMLARAALGPERPVAYASPTFGFYCTQGQVENAPILEIPYDQTLHLPVEKLIEARAALTFVANPDSPTGAWVDNQILAHLARNVAGLLVIDEAYVDFAGQTAMELLDAFENVILLRTLSKGYSLAGLRMGYGICNPDLIQELLKVKQIYNVDTLADTLAAAAVSDQEYKNRCCSKVVESRGKLAQGLEQLGWGVEASRANFLLARPPGGNPQQIAEDLKARRILVRYFQKGIVADRLRITVGTEEENQQLLAALKEIG
jgi:histidinol-phosphate aminotransferase